MRQTLIVVDDDSSFSLGDLEIIGFERYLRDYPKLNETRTQVINLCDTDRYLSKGYYCSLLAEARKHDALPTIRVINALRDNGESLWVKNTLLSKNVGLISFGQPITICMGETRDPALKKLASWIFQQFPTPLLSVTLTSVQEGLHAQVKQQNMTELTTAGFDFCTSVLHTYEQKTWRKHKAETKYRWDLAMLINPDEKHAPSDKSALKRFVKAGQKLGINVHTVTLQDMGHLAQYDGLFIRETTAIDHHTYRIARQAAELGLVVVDDPDSILRCCNKVFLHDAFNYKKVPSLRTHFVHSAAPEVLDMLKQKFGFPLILKMPEGSFSRGVFRVENQERLQTLLGEMLQDSALVLAQEYLFTEFDWRIGVLNGRALYACRYHMARHHWQIYRHGTKRSISGACDTLPTFEVPKKVLSAALKACAVVGNGLYGVDIKEVGGKAYVIEVNDNPNIDHGYEDLYLGDELYMQIMSEFLRRFEQHGLREA